MRDFAMTYPQLMNQAARLNVAEADLIRLRDGYELAQRLSDGLYRKEGAPFLCHLVRTASIVLVEVEGRDLDVVLATLLHAVYFLHYFERSSRRGPRAADRRFLRTRIGERAERLVTQCGAMSWNDADSLRGYLDDAGDSRSETRQLLLMQLANELEDHLDAAVAYAPHVAANTAYLRHGALYVALAERLGHAILAGELREAFEACRRTEVPAAVTQSGHGSYELTSRLWTANLVERMGSSLRRYRERRSSQS